MFFSKEYIQNLKEHVDTYSLISEYVTLKKSGSVYIGKCPNPAHIDKTPSFRYFPNTKTWACMGCHCDNKGLNNYGTDCIAFVQWINNYTWIDAVKYLANKCNIPLPNKKYEKIYKNNYRLALRYNENLTEKPIKYLLSRNIDYDEIKKYLIGYDKITNRIVFPLFDVDNDIVGFSNRRLNPEDDRKYINSKNTDWFNKSVYFYNINNVDLKKGYIRIVEGPTDVIMGTKYNVDNLVGILGKVITDSHINIIKNMNIIPIFILDGDSYGQKGITNAIYKCINKNIDCKVFVLPSQMDMCDFALKNRYDTLDIINRETVDGSYYLIKNIISKYDEELMILNKKYYKDLIEIYNNIYNQEEKEFLKSYINYKMKVAL